ncbi:hypothetical protein [Microbacterium sp. NPDC096154]|uniref:hypothetical protein n=1 Tax=Microbacterium sp. NPDC096154 TaxID=3155549 RepID=UPI00331F8A03
MRRATRLLLGIAVLAGSLAVTACGARFPELPEAVGEDFPDGAIHTAVAWPSDWLEGLAGESEAVGGQIVGLRLEFVDDTWMWRLRSRDPGYDLFGESITEPDRGREALVDAATHEVVAQRHVELTEAELTPGRIAALTAARLSGERYPSPRIVAMESIVEDDGPAWRITLRDTETGAQSLTTVSEEPLP